MTLKPDKDETDELMQRCDHFSSYCGWKSDSLNQESTKQKSVLLRITWR